MSALEGKRPVLVYTWASDSSGGHQWAFKSSRSAMAEIYSMYDNDVAEPVPPYDFMRVAELSVAESLSGADIECLFDEELIEALEGAQIGRTVTLAELAELTEPLAVSA